MQTIILRHQHFRIFSPVILFHDHEYIKDSSGNVAHVHIAYGDPHYGPAIETHKKRIHRMLEHNERFWSDIRGENHGTFPLSVFPSWLTGISYVMKKKDCFRLYPPLLALVHLHLLLLHLYTYMMKHSHHLHYRLLLPYQVIATGITLIPPIHTDELLPYHLLPLVR